MPAKDPSYIQACARCNSEEIKCLARGRGACERCSALDVECTQVINSCRSDNHKLSNELVTRLTPLQSASAQKSQDYNHGTD